MARKYLQYVEHQNEVFIEFANDDGTVEWMQTDVPDPIYIDSSDVTSELKTIYGDSVEEIQFDTIKEQQQFIREHPELANRLHGPRKPGIGIINSLTDLIPATIDDYNYCAFDIETEVGNEFPRPDQAKEAVNMITMKQSKCDWYDCYTTVNVDFDEIVKIIQEHGDKNFTADNLRLTIFDTEVEMLVAFMQYFVDNHIQIITGWNSENFDIQYLGTRISNLLGEDALKQWSRFNRVLTRSFTNIYNEEVKKFDPVGLLHLDAMQLHKKRIYVNYDSRTLDNIANIELGVGKLQHESGIPGHLLYKSGFPSAGLAYNLIDVMRLVQIIKKTALLDLEVTLAQLCKINLADNIYVTRIVLGYMYQFLRQQNILMPLAFEAPDSGAVSWLEGGYVQDPIVGLHRYVVSGDIASSYPSTMRAVNISPEVKGPRLKKQNGKPFDEDDMLNGNKSELPLEMFDKDFLEKYTIAANGQAFRRDKRGVFALMLDDMYAQRNIYKNKAIELKAQAADIAIKASQTSDPDEVKRLKEIEEALLTQSKASKQTDNAVKIGLNSSFGALASDKFLFFDMDCADAVTANGRLALKNLIDKLPKFCNKQNMAKALNMYNMLPVIEAGKHGGNFRELDVQGKYDGTDFVVQNISSDTDSVFLAFDAFLDHVHFSDDPDVDTKAKLAFCCWFGDFVLQQAIDKSMSQIDHMTNALVPGLIKADRETVAIGGLWLAKKKYTLLVYDQEGARYPDYTQKTLGLSFIQGSASATTKERMKLFVRRLLLEGVEAAHETLMQYQNELRTLPIDDITISLSANDFERFTDYENYQIVPQKKNGKLRRPIFPNDACVMHNLFIEKLGKTAEIPKLMDGSRVRVVLLRQPNPVGYKAIAYEESWPEWFNEVDLGSYIDYRGQFEKIFKPQINKIYEALNINPAVNELDLM